MSLDSTASTRSTLTSSSSSSSSAQSAGMTNSTSSTGTFRPKVNPRSTAVKRIMREAAELAELDLEEDDFVAAPLENDVFEWHVTMRGVAGSEYEGGIYHLRLVLPPTYPMSPPDILLLTPSGRFECNKKICIDGLTSFHVGSWQPAWGVRTAILGLRSFWMQDAGEALGAVGALNCGREEKVRLAKLDWTCPTCQQCNKDILPDRAVAAPLATSSGKNVSEDLTISSETDRPHVPQVNADSFTSDAVNGNDRNLIQTDATPASPVPSSSVPLFSASKSIVLPSLEAGTHTAEGQRPAHRPPPTCMSDPASSPLTDASSSDTSPSVPSTTSQPSDRKSTPAVTPAPTARQEPLRTEETTYTARESAFPVYVDVPPSTEVRSTPIWLDALIATLGFALMILFVRKVWAGEDEMALRASLSDL